MALQAYDWIDYYARTTPNKRAMYDLASRRDFSYSQMNERVARVAGMLRETGIQPGDRVAFLCLNTCLLYTSPSPRDKRQSRMPSSA